MVQNNEIKRINDVLAEGIRARANDPTLNDLFGLGDVANGALADILGTFTNTENLKAILGDLSTTKRLGQILGALDETNTLKAILGAYTQAAPLKTDVDAILEDTKQIADDSLPASPAAGSLARFIASGGTALGTPLPASKSLYDGLLGGIDAVNRVAGKAQTATTTIDLNQAAGTYDLFTGTAQSVIVEKLIISMPNANAGGALTSIRIHTNHTTQQEFISATNGAVGNLTAENQLASDSPISIGVGKKIQLTIAGGATGVSYICTVEVIYRAVTSGGYLA
jgi:hypothetical protein